jgi:hypothetical protein
VPLGAVRTLPIGTTVRTTGVVVAEAGRLGTPALLAIGASDAGLVVHLPADSPTFARGALIEVAGKLAAPYGQLEIRPVKGDVRSLGTDALPRPMNVPSAGLAEAMEGRLATATGRLTAKPRKSASGDLTLIIERDGAAPIKVMADASSRVTTSLLQVGATYRITGFVGQRATRAGAFDGYRIWARDAADLVVVAGPPPSGSPSPSARGSAAAIATVSIAVALHITDRPVAILAVVTGPATLLDATGRRIVVQDGSAAIELLLPTGTEAPSVGSRVRAEGRIGVAYGAPRLRADRLVVEGTASVPPPVTLHGSPGQAHEWRLVAVTGRIVSLTKLGDRWRAEVQVGGSKVVVIGQPGARIPSTTLSVGRTATVIGIARRPYPSATDRRFAVTPRFPADVRVAGGTDPGATSATGGSSTAAPQSGSTEAGAEPTSAAVPDADLVDLDLMIGQVVRVGGLVVDLRPDGFTIDDGTAIGRVVLRGAALDRLGLVEPDDALNAIGRVESTAVGAVVVVEDPAGILQAGDPVAVASTAAPASSAAGGLAASAEATGPSSRYAGLGGPLPFDAGTAGLGTLVAISVASVAVTLLRRAHARRRMTARIAARLAAFAGPAEGLSAASPAEREPSTIHSA